MDIDICDDGWRPVAPALGTGDDMVALADELLGNLPLRYIDGPEYCTVKDATGGDFALTVQPELMKRMEAALSAPPASRIEQEAIRPPALSGREAMREALGAVKHWAKTRCPCEDGLPDPCTLCGARADKDACRAIEGTFPRGLLERIDAALPIETQGTGVQRTTEPALAPIVHPSAGRDAT